MADILVYDRLATRHVVQHPLGAGAVRPCQHGSQHVLGGGDDQRRALDLLAILTQVHLLHGDAGLDHGLDRVEPDDGAHHLDQRLAVGAIEKVGTHGLGHHVIGEFRAAAPSLRHMAPGAEHDAPHGVALRKRAVAHHADAAVRVFRRKLQGDHAAGGSAHHVRPFDLKGIEQRGQVVRPNIEVVAHQGAVGLPVAALVVADELERFGESLPHHREVLAPEERAADQRQWVAFAHQLVVDIDSIGVDLRHDEFLPITCPHHPALCRLCRPTCARGPRRMMDRDRS